MTNKTEFAVGNCVTSQTDSFKCGYIESFGSIEDINCVSIILINGQSFITTTDDLVLVPSPEDKDQ